MSKVRLDWRLLEKAAVAIKQAAEPRFGAVYGGGPSARSYDPRQISESAKFDRPLAVKPIRPWMDSIWNDRWDDVSHEWKTDQYTPPSDWHSRMRKALSGSSFDRRANLRPTIRSLLDWSPIASDAELNKRVGPAVQFATTPPHLRPDWVPHNQRIPVDANGDGEISRSEQYAPTVAEADWEKLTSTPGMLQELSRRASKALSPYERMNNTLPTPHRGAVEALAIASKKYGLTKDDQRWLFSPRRLYRSQPGRDTSGLRTHLEGFGAGPRDLTSVAPLWSSRYYRDINQGRLERALNAALAKRGLPPQLRHWQKPTPKHLRMPAAGSWGSFWESAFPSLMAKREKARSDEYDMRRQMLTFDRPAHHPETHGPPLRLRPKIPGRERSQERVFDHDAVGRYRGLKGWRRKTLAEGGDHHVDPGNPAWKDYTDPDGNPRTLSAGREYWKSPSNFDWLPHTDPRYADRKNYPSIDLKPDDDYR